MRKLKLASLLNIILYLNINSYAGVLFEKITLEEAIEKAKQTGKLIMIDIYTDWCVPCKELDKRIFQDTKIGHFINERFISLKINAEKGVGPELCKKYQVPASYPTVLFLDSEGKEIDRIVGLFAKEDYFKTIQDYAQGKNTFSALLTQLQSGNNSPTLYFKIGKKYAERGLWKQAAQHYEKALSDQQYATDGTFWWNIGMAYFKIKELAKAEKAISKAIELEPDNPYLKEFLDKIKSELHK